MSAAPIMNSNSNSNSNSEHDILVHLQAVLSQSFITAFPLAALQLLIHTLTQHPPHASHPAHRHSLLRALVSHASPQLVHGLLLDPRGARLVFDWIVLEDSYLGKQDEATGSANMLCRLLALASPALNIQPNNNASSPVLLSSPTLIFLRTTYSIQHPSCRHSAAKSARTDDGQTSTALSIVQRWSRASSFSLKRSAALLLRRGSDADKAQLASSLTSAPPPASALSPSPTRSLADAAFCQAAAHLQCHTATQRSMGSAYSQTESGLQQRADAYINFTGSGSSSIGRISNGSETLPLPTLSPPTSYETALLLTGGSGASSLASLSSLPKIHVPSLGTYSGESATITPTRTASFCPPTSMSAGSTATATSTSASSSAFPPLPCASMSFPKPMSSKYELAIFEYEGARREWAVNGMPPEVAERYQAWLKEQRAQQGQGQGNAQAVVAEGTEATEEESSQRLLEKGKAADGEGDEQSRRTTTIHWADGESGPISTSPTTTQQTSQQLRRPSLSSGGPSNHRSGRSMSTSSSSFDPSRNNSYSTLVETMTPLTTLASTSSTPTPTPGIPEEVQQGKKRKLDEVMSAEAEVRVSSAVVELTNTPRRNRARTARVV
ncbi:unnamed protein product [Tilletia controversa]|nr:unnamed protein product [Tilletia controversa]